MATDRSLSSFAFGRGVSHPSRKQAYPPAVRVLEPKQTDYCTVSDEEQAGSSSKHGKQVSKSSSKKHQEKNGELNCCSRLP